MSQATRILKRKIDELKKRNEQYSIRALSRRLEVNPSTLSRFIAGDRGISMELAEKICIRLAFDPQQRMEFLKAVSAPAELDPKIQYLQISADQYNVIGQWQHYAILSLLHTTDFQSDSAWIAKRLGISEQCASDSLERLERVGLIQKDSGNWKRTSEAIRTSDDIRSQSLQQAHKQNMELAAKALTDVPISQRDFTAITMPVNPELLPRAKELIRRLQDDLSELMDTQPSTEVYKFCTQLIPLTKIEDSVKGKSELKHE